MKGVAVAAIAAVLLACFGLAVANPPLPEPLQYEQFCENQKVSGTGTIDINTQIIDKKIALEYMNYMAGDGDIEIDQTHAYSQKAKKLERNVSAVNDTRNSSLNLWENTKLTYNSEHTPLVGGKYLHSKAFYGGIGADVTELFAVNQMEKEQTGFFVSTANLNNIGPNAEKMASKLKDAGLKDVMANNEGNVSKLMGNDPAHLIGIDTKSSFNGTWGVDATWHKIFYKDIKLHQAFSGKFEVEKLIKFHEYPVPEIVDKPCKGIDC